MNKEQCEFCNKKRKTATTQFFGRYCIECIKTVIEQCKEAIKEIREIKK